MMPKPGRRRNRPTTGTGPASRQEKNNTRSTGKSKNNGKPRSGRRDYPKSSEFQFEMIRGPIGCMIMAF